MAAIVLRWQELENQSKEFVIPKTRAEALRLAADLEEKLEVATNLLIEQAPKVAYADAVAISSTSVQIGEFCKQVGIGRNSLFELMRDDKILIGGGVLYNTPYQQFIDAGYFEVQKSISGNQDGKYSMVTYLTAKGELWLCKRLKLTKKVIDNCK